MPMKPKTNHRLCWLSVMIGFCIIIGGCNYSIALRNPGGMPVSEAERQYAIRVFYVAAGIGAAVATLIPATLMYLQRRNT
jgi:hypothetical protein